MSDVDSSRQEFARLSWALLEYKLAYYRPELNQDGKYTIPDSTYDMLEQRYLALCEALGETNYLVHKKYSKFENMDYSQAMFEIDYERPSVLMAIRKMTGQTMP